MVCEGREFMTSTEGVGGSKVKLQMDENALKGDGWVGEN